VAQNRDYAACVCEYNSETCCCMLGEVILISRSPAGLSMAVLQAICLFVCLSFSRLRIKEKNMLVFLEVAF